MRTFLLILLAAGPVLAHEFWIEPATFTPAAGARVDLRLKVGDGFPGEPVRRNPKHQRAFFVAHGGTRTQVAGLDGKDPAGVVRLERPGLHVVGYRSTPTFVELDAKKFEAYLVEEGLDSARRLRRERGETGKPGRELYSRCAKSLLVVPGGAAARDTRLGLELEIVAEAIRPDGRCTFRVWHGDAPLPGALVRAFHPRTDRPMLARTDAEGRATFRLERAGRWLIGSVHMREAPSGARADWESLWASLTFHHQPEPKEKQQ